MTQVLAVPVRRLPHGEGLPLPRCMTTGAAGVDLLAAIADGEEIRLHPGKRCLVPAGIAVAIPEGFEGQVRPRSGMALRHGVTVLNGPGTIDADYRGEIGVILVHLGEEPLVICRGDRIAQLVIAPVARFAWQEVDALPASQRGEGGFGHTGLHTPVATT